MHIFCWAKLGETFSKVLALFSEWSAENKFIVQIMVLRTSLLHRLRPTTHLSFKSYLVKIFCVKFNPFVTNRHAFMRLEVIQNGKTTYQACCVLGQIRRNSSVMEKLLPCSPSGQLKTCLLFIGFQDIPFPLYIIITKYLAMFDKYVYLLADGMTCSKRCYIDLSL